ncbi:hypothetical protein BCR44DRAFT_1484799 [Catenaria anguillulae PL171]|uniref:Protein-serine/threonine kinase n=1 Tax=Catenaria anguillulae PL171 TaxID=765915 RepID=A0A1Y2HNE6_9FUNG|nr:hypothetical protein BCR44DRAFT_1484799 [Catenaria anguillulae PL171]
MPASTVAASVASTAPAVSALLRSTATVTATVASQAAATVGSAMSQHAAVAASRLTLQSLSASADTPSPLLTVTSIAHRHARTAALLRDLTASLPLTPNKPTSALATLADRFAHAASVLAQSPQSAPDDALPLLSAAHAEHKDMLRSLDKAWSPLVGTIISDPTLLARVRTTLADVHSTTLGTSLSLDQALLPPAKHLAVLLDPQLVAQHAIEAATHWATSTFGSSPQVTLTNQSTFHPLAVPHHVQGILFSTLCAALSASVEVTKSENLSAPPPVTLLIVNGSEDLCFKVSDKGPGLSQRQLAQVFNFGLIAAPLAQPRLPPLPFQLNQHPARTPETPIEGRAAAVAGHAGQSGLLHSALGLLKSLRLGWGASAPPATSMRAEQVVPVVSSLPATSEHASPVVAKSPEPNSPCTAADVTQPAVCRLLQQHAVSLSLARVHAQYFGGDLDMVSMQNYGSDTYLHLRKDTAQTSTPPDSNGDRVEPTRASHPNGQRHLIAAARLSRSQSLATV